MRDSKVKNIAISGILIALALLLSFLESQIPAFFAIPGMKLGLTNIVVVAALFLIGDKSAIVINVVRVLLVALLFGNGMALAYSIAGAVLSGAVMIALKHTGKFNIVAISITGGVCHNIGQILVAMILLETTKIAWYLLILWFTGIVTGAVIGIVSGLLCKRLAGIKKKA